VPTLLATGFGVWDDHQENASWEILQGIAPMVPSGWRLEVAKIPVSWAEAPVRLGKLLSDDVGAAVLFGQGSEDAIQVERVAVNLADPRRDDIDGKRHRAKVIEPDGPPAYDTGLPWKAVLGALGKADIPSRESRYAGEFLCNFAFYHLMHHISEVRPDVIGGFVHVPPLSAMPLETLKQAAEVVLGAVVTGK
jgi:pyroglutamyl-peptidase